MRLTPAMIAIVAAPTVVIVGWDPRARENTRGISKVSMLACRGSISSSHLALPVLMSEVREADSEGEGAGSGEAGAEEADGDGKEDERESEEDGCLFPTACSFFAPRPACTVTPSASPSKSWGCSPPPCVSTLSPDPTRAGRPSSQDAGAVHPRDSGRGITDKSSRGFLCGCEGESITARDPMSGTAIPTEPRRIASGASHPCRSCLCVVYAKGPGTVREGISQYSSRFPFPTVSRREIGASVNGRSALSGMRVSAVHMRRSSRSSFSPLSLRGGNSSASPPCPSGVRQTTPRDVRA